ncbi:nischarin-like [Metopolophium dirhodum]|uniref:nischarin-like n=1 Tax=Metopolophium dirhodum TaxID=44670 RepID=UPI00299052BF|nr:nischarin-like [Metopolophium dirhodum]XP_060878326.1 nischarin-like [Metopolophium dirhodum]
MSCYVQYCHECNIAICKAKTDTDGVTYYHIKVNVGDVTWSVQKRYNEFLELHKKLVNEHTVTKDILPGKKIIGNKEPNFIERRRVGLEIYLQTVLSFLQKSMPEELLEFLEFHKYDVILIVKKLAVEFFKNGDDYLLNDNGFNFNVLLLYAISERLKLPCPDSENNEYNFSHVLDFCSKFKYLAIKGGNHYVGTSNIIYNKLSFELSSFKNVKKFECYNIAYNMIYNLMTLRDTVRIITVYNSKLKTPEDILLSDNVHKEWSSDMDSSMIWNKVKVVDFSWNEILTLKSLTVLTPNVKTINLNGNLLNTIEDLSPLSYLSHLSLSSNNITEVLDLHTKLGNVICLNLSSNKISNLEAFSKLFSLEMLDLGSNLVEDIDQLEHLSGLQNMNYLVLSGNPVSTVVDYRIKVLGILKKRTSDFCLDNERPTQKELDTVAIMHAIKVAKEGKTLFDR